MTLPPPLPPPPLPLPPAERITVQRVAVGIATLTIDGKPHPLRRSEICKLINQLNDILPKLR